MNRNTVFILALSVAFQVVYCTSLLAQERASVHFFGSGKSPVLKQGTYDPAIPKPDEVLGYPLGERPARHAQVLEYFNRLDEASDRVQFFDMGTTYEGRPLTYAVISDETNMARLDEIKDAIQRIADPRKTSRSVLPSLVHELPVVVWLAYSIHGDEVSGVDASLAVAYHLVAGQDTLSSRIRKNVLTIIDPMENPDGRERFLAQMESFAAAVPHADGQSLQKGGFWPWGRGNHYLFDMNRDWFTQELPESKARISAIVDWHPQVLVDAHEMGQWDTYLFSPPRHPFNLQLTDRIRQWWGTFARDQAAAFDRMGWGYYTRDWNEEWYPGYGSSWPLYTGAIGILYEQAGVSGSRISRHDKTVLTYSESVQHHYVSSLANLSTAAANRRALLSDYYDHRAKAIETNGGGKVKAYLVTPDKNPGTTEHLAQALTRQEIEVRKATKAFSLSARNYYEQRFSAKQFPAGTMIITTNQPQGYLIQTILGFDPHLSDSFLVEERRELLKHRSSRLYEITSWSLLQAYGVDGYETETVPTAESVPWQPMNVAGSIAGDNPQQGFVMDGNSDQALRATAMMLKRGLTLHAALKDIDWEGKYYDRGAVFVPRRANPTGYQAILDSVAQETGVQFHGVNSGSGNVGPDIGSRDLGVLRSPKIALAAGGPTSFTSVGWIWHLLDQKLGVPVSLVDIGYLSQIDLSVYNVLILPDGGGFAGVMGKPAVENVRGWVERGGTLIAMGSAASFCADSTTKLSSVRPRDQVLVKLKDYQQAATEEQLAEKPDIKKLQIWEYVEEDTTKRKKGEKETPKGPSELPLEELKKADELAALFSPHGAILRAELDQEEWLTFGMKQSVPVMVTKSTVLASKYPAARTVARFAPPPKLRVSGLLWPEARMRLANSAYCTRENLGSGQIILFADQPNFRSFFRGSERMLSNALLFGTGLGTSWTPGW